MTLHQPSHPTGADITVPPHSDHSQVLTLDRCPVPLLNAVVDLDQSIVNSRPVHFALFQTLLRDRLGNSDSHITHARDTFSQFRGQAYSVIFRAMHQAMRDVSANVPEDLPAFIEAFSDVVTDVSEGKVTLDGQPEPIPGADTLLKVLADNNVNSILCTGSPRVIAEMLLKSIRAYDLFPAGRLHCSGDEHLGGYNKGASDYWDIIGLPAAEQASTVAFDDHPHSAANILSATKIPLLVLRVNSSPEDTHYFDALKKLREDFGARVHIIEDWAEILPEKNTEIVNL